MRVALYLAALVSFFVLSAQASFCGNGVSVCGSGSISCSSYCTIRQNGPTRYACRALARLPSHLTD
jgi:hypothetical protein